MESLHHKPSKLALLFAFAVGLIVGVVFAWNPTAYHTSTRAATPLGVNRQQLLDSLASVFTLGSVEDKPTLYVVKLGPSSATVAIQGPADAPTKTNVTGAYSKDTAPVIATAANLLAKSILGDADWYGPWAGAAIHKVEPGFDVVGTNSTNSGVVEVRMSKLDVNGELVLSIVFRRL